MREIQTPIQKWRSMLNKEANKSLSMKRIEEIARHHNYNEMEINKTCVDIFVDLLKQGKLNKVDWVKRYLTVDMYEAYDLKEKMINKLEYSHKIKKREAWWSITCDFQELRMLLHEHSIKNNSNNNIDVLNFVMFVCFKEHEI